MVHPANFNPRLSDKMIMISSVIIFWLTYTPLNYLFAVNGTSTIRSIEGDAIPPDSLPTIQGIATVEVPNYMSAKSKRQLIKEVKWELSDVKQKNKKHR